MKKCLMLFFLIASGGFLFAQQIKSPTQFLGYTLGERFTPHHRVIEYFTYIASSSKLVKLQEYGKTYEGRPLMVAFIGSPSTINRLDEIRNNNLKLTGIKEGSASLEQPAIVWLSYNVHGNESVSTEASMKTLFELVNPENPRTAAWLEKTLVIIDPCLNPDGRERYVNFFNSVASIKPDAYSLSREHLEPWPGGRFNHYYFDLNRDWAWQTQVETQQRMALFNQWLPQIHVDFHEQGINDPYFFAPAAEPLHEDISKWQREFQTTIGKNNARYFDEKGWLYFTKERFDLLYPSYGDTYPTYNGAIGMTYEQGGSGQAGLAVITSSGDTLTLSDRLEHHYTSGLSTIESASQNAKRLVAEFQNYFLKSKTSPSGTYKTYVVKADNTERLQRLTDLLSRNGIEYGFGITGKANGFSYFNRKTEDFEVANADLIISAYQPKSVLLKVLFEPSTFVSDSATYDITAWALPYAYGLNAYACKATLRPKSKQALPVVQESLSSQKPVAFVANWGSVADVKFLSVLLRNEVKVRYSEVPFQTSGQLFNQGSLVITRAGNEKLGNNFESVLTQLAKQASVSLQPVLSGFLEKGSDLGSDKIKVIRKPRLALVGGDDTSPTAFGEIWHFFEQQIHYPISLLRSQDLKRINLNEFDGLIFPDGSSFDQFSELLYNWVLSGGKLIVMESSAAQLAGKKGFAIQAKEGPKPEKGKAPELRKYQDRERDRLKNSIPGAIYQVHLDNSHPLGFGLPALYHTLKLDNHVYNYLEAGWNVGVLKKDSHVAGFVGNQAKKQLQDGMLFGVQEIGNGSVVYLSDNPLFRSFWENGKLLFSNAVFMVGN